MVKIGSDVDGIELEPGDSISINGEEEWTYSEDGTLAGPALDVGGLYHTYEDLNFHASEKRRRTTTERVEVYVDPDDGDDDAEGTELDPIQTIGEALNRCPFHIEHQYRVYLGDGTYNEGHPKTTTGHFVGEDYDDEGHPLKIIGNESDPSAVQIDDTLSFPILTGEIEKAVLSDVTMNGTLLAKFGGYSVRNITFTGTSEHALDTGGSVLGFDSHAASTVIFRDCTFADTLDIGAQIADGGKILFRNCSGNPSEWAAFARRGGTVHEINAGGLMGDRGFCKRDTGGRYIGVDGLNRGRRGVGGDDWSDGRLQNRYGPEVAGWAPEWDLQLNDAHAENGAVVLPPDSRIRSPYFFWRDSAATWRFAIEPEAVDPGDELRIYPVWSSGGWWQIALRGDGELELLTSDESELVVGSWPAQAETFDLEVTRDESGEWELLANGSVEGTATRADFWPTNERLRVWNTGMSDTDYRITGLKIDAL